MLKIKFSHDYVKFIGKKLPFEATLLQCFLIVYEELSEYFLRYDTLFSDKKGVDDMYPLHKGMLIVLLFWDTHKFMFTTIRRYTPNKWKYYTEKVGHDFEIVRI